MGDWTSISAKLKELITGIQDGGAAVFVEVNEHPSTEYSGYPSVAILPQTMPSEYATNTENRRSYIFDVFIYLQLDHAGYDQAFSRMRKLIDDVVHAIDITQNLDGLVGFVRPVPSEWFETATSSGTYLGASVQVVCVVDRDIM